MTNLTLRAACAAGICLVMVAAPTRAEQRVASKPATPSPAAKPVSPSAELPGQKKMAVKLAGLVAFVANSCPQLKPDYSRFKATIAALGVGVDQLDTPAMKTTYVGYTSQYQTDVKGNCVKAREQFGPGGKVVPDIFTVADAKAK